MIRIFAVIAAVLFPIAALAAPITVHNTGVDGTDALVAMGAQTTFWTLLSAPPGATETVGSDVFRYAHPAYIADSLESAWVSQTASGNVSVLGVYVYQLLVDLTGLDFSTVPSPARSARITTVSSESTEPPPRPRADSQASARCRRSRWTPISSRASTRFKWASITVQMSDRVPRRVLRSQRDAD